ncbi:MAG: hypothetical protein KF688_09050 [Pirellulales bacterium]|nr:hypothetical protein [Pirellulales bacterium]
MADMLQEFVDSRGLALRVDRDAGVLRGVKLIGLESRNGRRYRPQALERAAALYEGAKVNVNHPKDGPLAPRDYRDRLGVIREVEFRPDEGLFGTLQFNPKHALAEQLAWDAVHNPRNVGFSHNVLARVVRDGDAAIVDEITRVQSVDLVADPAATEGLFEQAGEDVAVGASEVDLPPTWDALTLAVLATHRPDLLDEIRRQCSSAVEEQLVAARVEARSERRRRVVAMELARRGAAVPHDDRELAQQVGESLLATLLGLEDEARFTALVEEQAGRLAAKRRGDGPAPRSVEQRLALRRSLDKVATVADFVRAIRGR